MNAFDNLGTGSAISTARYGCCPANKYMSSPEGTGTFVEADSCSACPAGTKISSLTSVPNDETSCFVKIPDDCKGIVWTNRSCGVRKAVDILNADGSGTHPTYGPMKDWDISLVTDLIYLFRLKGTMNVDLSSWDVSSVTNMQGAFYQAKLFNSDVSGWDVSRVTTMYEST